MSAADRWHAMDRWMTDRVEHPTFTSIMFIGVLVPIVMCIAIIVGLLAAVAYPWHAGMLALGLLFGWFAARLQHGPTWRGLRGVTRTALVQVSAVGSMLGCILSLLMATMEPRALWITLPAFVGFSTLWLYAELWHRSDEAPADRPHP